MTAIKDDKNKPRFSLVPPEALLRIAEVFTHGATSEPGRTDDQWREGYSYRKMLDALERHLNAFKRGEDLDPKSKLPHMAHAAANCMMILEMPAKWDDRHTAQDRAPTQLELPLNLAADQARFALKLESERTYDASRSGVQEGMKVYNDE